MHANDGNGSPEVRRQKPQTETANRANGERPGETATCKIQYQDTYQDTLRYNASSTSTGATAAGRLRHPTSYDTEIFFSIPTPIDRPAIAGWAKARIVRPDRPSFHQRRGRKRWGRNPPLREGLSDSVRERRSSPPARRTWPAPVFPRMSRERPDVSVFSERCENKRSSRALYPFRNAPHIRHRRSARSRSACSCLSVVEPHSPQTHGH